MIVSILNAYRCAWYLAWYLGEFNPETHEEFSAIISGDQNTSFRMVIGYWDMAASQVTTECSGSPGVSASAFLKPVPLMTAFVKGGH
jgi:hypothetical protein